MNPSHTTHKGVWLRVGDRKFVFTIMFKGSALSYVTAVPALGMAAFIFIIESFIVLLQAYVFTYLSIIFLHQAIHQEH